MYVLSGKIPTEKAHGVQVAYTCTALSGIKDINVVLLSMRTNTLSKISVFNYYGIDINLFKHVQIYTTSLFNPLIIFSLLQRFIFVSFCLFYVFYKYNRDTVIYTRDEITCYFFSLLGFRTFFEVHDIRKNFLFKKALKNSQKNICVSMGLQKDILKIYSQESVLIRNGVTDDSFGEFDISEFRRSLNIEEKRKIITYTGGISNYNWKGVDLFLEASKVLTDYTFLCVGGTIESINNFKRDYSNDNLIFISHVQHIEVQKYQLISHLLVLPNKQGNILSEKYTSPLKIFEYMKTGIPIVSSDLPSIREIVGDSEVTFFKPGNLYDLVKKINFVFTNKKDITRKTELAQQKVKDFSYRARAQKIYLLLQKNNF